MYSFEGTGALNDYILYKDIYLPSEYRIKADPVMTQGYGQIQPRDGVTLSLLFSSHLAFNVLFIKQIHNKYILNASCTAGIILGTGDKVMKN